MARLLWTIRWGRFFSLKANIEVIATTLFSFFMRLLIHIPHPLNPFFLVTPPSTYSFLLERNSMDLPSTQLQPNTEDGEVILLQLRFSFYYSLDVNFLVVWGQI
jgi:hypothetical protein